MREELKKLEQALNERGKLAQYNKSRTNFYHIAMEGPQGNIFVIYDAFSENVFSGSHKQALAERDKLVRL